MIFTSLFSIPEKEMSQQDKIDAGFHYQKKQIYLNEYSALRDEILKRMGLKHQVLYFTLIIWGTLLTFGLKEPNNIYVLLLYPILAMFLACSWSHQDTRTGQIGMYIKTKLENEKLPELGWENDLARKMKWVILRFSEIIALGIFIGLDILCIVIAKSQLDSLEVPLSNQYNYLYEIDKYAIAITFLVIFKRRINLYFNLIKEKKEKKEN